ncbi:unnamed protein product [Cyprideis torosa]|uniref:FAD dependent oxidoreductase domain-containing protein n=1 Tax=Cyprideis torosa TaxID=163714 RepID=A0A7R8W462_9CRUS|nr:unnamed protein product [Cyprideis torosa]CAG0882824.1 unnamed protein product [Cyprideis torosa]
MSNLQGGMYDAIVIGAGIMGAWTALHLVRRGKRTLLLEQFPLLHTRGSSHGQSRIFRFAYPEEHQTIMSRDSLDLWRELEISVGGKTLLKNCPLLRIGEMPEDHHFIRDCLQSLQHTCPDESSFQELTSKSIQKDYPGLQFQDTVKAVVDYNGGVLLADSCLKACLQVFQTLGGTLKDSTKISSILPGSVVRVTDIYGQEYLSKSLVIACGGWSDRLLRELDLHLPLAVVKIPIVYFRIRPGFEKHPKFAWIVHDPKYREIWGIPESEYPGLWKFGSHYGPVIDPDFRDSTDVGYVVENVSKFVKKHFKFLDPTPAIVEHCMYTITPDSLCILDRHARYPNISFACGFSGSGFKLSPMVGKIMADFACGVTPPEYVKESLSAQRFSNVQPRWIQHHSQVKWYNKDVQKMGNL